MAFERLSEEEWQLLEKLVRSGKSLRGRPPKQHRKIFEAVFWIASCDVPWRSLPEHFGKWNTVYRQFKRWSENDLWNRVLKELENNPALMDISQGLKHNALATRRLALQRQTQPPSGTSSTNLTGVSSSSSHHVTDSGKTLEASSVNL